MLICIFDLDLDKKYIETYRQKIKRNQTCQLSQKLWFSVAKYNYAYKPIYRNMLQLKGLNISGTS